MNRRSVKKFIFVPGPWNTVQSLWRNPFVQKQQYSTLLLRRFLLFFTTVLVNFSVFAQKKTIPAAGILKISFVNTVNGVPLVLNDSVYINSFNESYQVNKLKYYISNVRAINNSSTHKEKKSYHLINEAEPSSLHFNFLLPPNKYNSIEFLLGVDSLRNCSGAQTGALDPLNDMFWTWNSGYVMLKLEGSSSLSEQMNNRIEYHIGGYSGLINVMKKISLRTAFEIKAHSTTELIIETDINKLWQQPNELKIIQSPVCTTPGVLAKKIAENCSKMFSIKNNTLTH